MSQKHATWKSRKTASASLPGHMYENTYRIIEQHLNPNPKPQTQNSLHSLDKQKWLRRVSFCNELRTYKIFQSLWNSRDHSTQPVWQNYWGLDAADCYGRVQAKVVCGSGKRFVWKSCWNSGGRHHCDVQFWSAGVICVCSCTFVL